MSEGGNRGALHDPLSNRTEPKRVREAYRFQDAVVDAVGVARVRPKVRMPTEERNHALGSLQQVPHLHKQKVKARLGAPAKHAQHARHSNA